MDTPEPKTEETFKERMERASQEHQASMADYEERKKRAYEEHEASTALNRELMKKWQDRSNSSAAPAPVPSVGPGGRDVPPGREDDYRNRLQQARQGGTPVPDTAPRAVNGGGTPYPNFDEEGNEQAPFDERQRRWADRMRALQRAGQLGMRLAGYGGAGDIGPGALKGAGVNQVGRAASRLAERHGVTKGKSTAIGGAVAGALAGEGVKGMVQTAGSWYALYIAFGLLPTLLGSVPALLYLNFHYIMSVRGSEYFRPMFFWQKMTLLFADILALIALFIIAILIVSIYQMLENPSGALQFIS